VCFEISIFIDSQNSSPKLLVNYREKKIARVDPETNPTAPKGRRLSWHLTQKERPWSRYNAQKWENMGLGPPAAASEASLHRV